MSTLYSYYIHLLVNIGTGIKEKLDKWMSNCQMYALSWSCVYVNKQDMNYSFFTNVITLLNVNEPFCTIYVLSIYLSISISFSIYIDRYVELMCHKFMKQ